MATSPMVGGADPAILKSLEAQTPSVARTSPATVNAVTGAETSTGGTVSRGLVPQVSGGTVTYNQATQATAGNSVTVTSSTSNDPGDVVTIYTSPKAVSVSSVNQTVNSYKVNNYAGNEYTDSDVANYLPTFTGNVGAGNVNVTGGVYTYNLSSTGLTSLTNLNVSATANLGNVANVIIRGGSNGQVLTTNGSNVLSWTTVSGGNSSYGNTDVANYLPTFTGNIGANVVSANLFVGSGANLTNIAGANVGGFVPNANVANTAFAVAAANVSGLGNIATINLTGSTSNVLYGNGVFAAVAGSNSSQISNGNSNVSIPTSNDNVYITTNNGTSKQWIFNKDGSLVNPGNVDIYGGINFPQQVSSLNWSTYNIELSQYGRINTNVDFFANANTIGALYLKGDGSNISNIAGANVSGLGNIATINLDGNVSNLITGTGTFVAIPTVPSVGNIATINLDGNVSNLLTGTGTFVAIPTVSVYGDSNVVTLLGAFGSNTIVTTGNANVGNLGTATAIITTGNITTINGGLLQNGNSNITITSNGNISIQAAGSNVELVVTSTGANVTGTLTSTGKIGYASGSTVTQTTNRGTGVTINTLAGTIITTSAAMAVSEIDTFSVTNSSVDPTSDIVLAQIVSPNQGTYNCIATPAVIGGFNPGFFLNIVNISGFTTSDETITIRFMVIKAPNA